MHRERGRYFIWTIVPQRLQEKVYTFSSLEFKIASWVGVSSSREKERGGEEGRRGKGERGEGTSRRRRRSYGKKLIILSAPWCETATGRHLKRCVWFAWNNSLSQNTNTDYDFTQNLLLIYYVCTCTCVCMGGRKGERESTHTKVGPGCLPQ